MECESVNALSACCECRFLYVHTPMLQLEISSHGDAKQGVASEQYVGLAQPQQPRVPGLVIHIEQEEHAGDDVAAEGDEHQGLSTLI